MPLGERHDRASLRSVRWNRASNSSAAELDAAAVIPKKRP
jgi:hypothetical protein